MEPEALVEHFEEIEKRKLWDGLAYDEIRYGPGLAMDTRF